MDSTSTPAAGHAVGGPAIRERRQWAALLLVPLVLVLYLRTLTVPFIYDDYPILALNAERRAQTKLTDYFAPSYWNHEHPGTPGLYRPLREMAFALLYRAGVTTPRGHHVVSVALHAANALLLYALCRRLGAADVVAGLAATLFAAHPLLTEAVVWSKSLADPLCAFFALIEAVCFARALSTDRAGWRVAAWGAAAMLGLAAGLLTREIALGLVPVCAWMAWRGKGARRWAGLLAPVLLAVAYLWFQYRYLGLGQGLSGRYQVPLSLRAALFLKTLAFYVRMMLVPFGQCIDHAFAHPAHLFGKGMAADYFVLALAACAAWFLWRAGRLTRLGVLWTAAFLLPVSNLVPYSGRGVGESRAYVATAGVCLCLGWAATRALACRPKRLGACAVVALVAVFGVQTLARIERWQTPRRIWTDGLRKAPSNDIAHGALAREYYMSGRPEMSEGFLRRAVALAPTSLDHREKLARFLAATGRRPEARRILEKPENRP